jgi:hypothetical protein
MEHRSLAELGSVRCPAELYVATLRYLHSISILTHLNGAAFSLIRIAGAAAGVRVTRTCPLPCAFIHGDDGRDTADAVIMELVNHPKFGFGRDVPIPWPEKRPNPRYIQQAVGAPPSGIPESLPLVGLFYFEPTDQYPGYTTANKEIMEHVDFSVTPEQSSTLPITLVCPWGRTINDFVNPPPPKVAGNLIAYFNEHGVGMNSCCLKCIVVVVVFVRRVVVLLLL